MRYQLIQYNHIRFNFLELVKDVLDGQKLETLHQFVEGKYTELFKVGEDSSTIFHKAFYDRYRAGWPKFEKVYEEFIKEEISRFYPGDFLYQAWPTFRVHLPQNLCVGAFHTDAEFGHPEGEINYIVPLTSSNYTASVWIEGEPDSKDYEPALMLPGYVICFNGNKLSHGSKVNETNETRVSIDFRILPMDKYDENNNSESITRKTKFKIGEYYKLFKR